MQSDLLFAVHNPHSYPKRFSADVSVFVETPCYQPTRQKHRGGGGVLAFLFFVLFTLSPLPPPLLNQSRKSLAINHFPPSLLSASTPVTSPCLPPPSTSSHIPLSISVTQFTRLIYPKHCSPLIPPGSRHTLITQNHPVESSMNSHSAIRLSSFSLCSLCRLTSQNLLTCDLCPSQVGSHTPRLKAFAPYTHSTPVPSVTHPS